MPNFFQRIFKSEKRANDVKVVTNARAYNPHSISTNFNLNNAELNSTVFTCINIIANTISKLDVFIYKNENGKKVKNINHKWFNSLAYFPNQLSRKKFIQNALTTMYLTGNAFYYIDSINRKLIELGELEKVSPLLENEIWYKFKGFETWIPSKSLVHLYLLSKDGRIGINPICAIQSEIQIQKGSENALMNTFENGLLSTLFLEADIEGAKLTENNKAKEFLNKLESDFQGFQNSGKIPTIPPLYKLKSLPTQQIDFLANSKYTISQIGALFQVPETFLGVQNSSTYGKAEQQVSFFNTCLSNVCSLISDELNSKLLTIQERNSGVIIEFDFKNLYDIDPVEKSSYLKTLSSVGAITPNEIREQFNLELIDNEFMNYTYQQAQYIPVQLMDKNNLISNNIKINDTTTQQ